MNFPRSIRWCLVPSAQRDSTQRPFPLNLHEAPLRQRAEEVLRFADAADGVDDCGPHRTPATAASVAPEGAREFSCGTTDGVSPDIGESTVRNTQSMARKIALASACWKTYSRSR